MVRRGAIPPSLIGSMLGFMPWTFFRITPIWGSCLSFFNLSQIVIPTTAVFTSRRILSTTWLCKTLFYSVLQNRVSPFILCYHLPTTSSALYLATPVTKMSRLLTTLSFLGASLIFAAAVGTTPALLYATLWIIPALCSALGVQSIIARSFVATFLGHAWGAAIWAWAYPIMPMEWVALIPIAIFERMIIATAISFCSHGILYISKCHIPLLHPLYRAWHA